MSYIFGFAEYTLVVMTTRVADERVFSRRGLAVWRRINMHASKATRRCANGALYPSEHSDAISAAVVVAGIAVFPIPDIRIVAIRIVATDLWSSVPRGS